MKKTLSVILSLSMLMCLFSLSANAQKVDDADSSTSGLYISTQSCPDGYVEYANANIQRYLLSVNPAELPSEGVITVGNPFCFSNAGSDIFYFPVICNDEIIYMLRVFPKEAGGYGGVLGKSFVSELNALAETTSYSTPLSMMMEQDSVVAYVGSEKYTIYTYPDRSMDDGNNDISPTSIAAYQVVDVKEENSSIDCTVNVESLLSSTFSTSPMQTMDSRFIPTGKFLATSITETQGSESWCAAYATAMIIRCINGKSDSTSAYDVMEYHFSDPSSSDSIGEAEVVQYANSRSIYPTHITSTLSDTSLINEIVNSRPVYLRMYRVSGSDKIYHAVVLRGYDSGTRTWSIWNPWYDFYDYFDMGGTYVPAEHSYREYIYCHTIYNWQ